MAMTDKTPRERSIIRLFRNAGSPELQPRADLDCTAVIFQFPDNTVIEVDLAQFFDGSLPKPGVGRAAAAFGINTSMGNAGNTAKGEVTEANPKGKASPEEQKEAMQTRFETLQSGKWASDAVGGGARPSLLLAAIREHREQNDRPTDDATMAAIRTKLRDDEELAKEWSQIPELVAIMNRIKSERAMAAAKGNAEAAGVLD